MSGRRNIFTPGSLGPKAVKRLCVYVCLPVTRSCRFICADDICCALQMETFSEIM